MGKEGYGFARHGMSPTWIRLWDVCEKRLNFTNNNKLQSCVKSRSRVSIVGQRLKQSRGIFCQPVD